MAGGAIEKNAEDGCEEGVSYKYAWMAGQVLGDWPSFSGRPFFRRSDRQWGVLVPDICDRLGRFMADAVTAVRFPAAGMDACGVSGLCAG